MKLAKYIHDLLLENETVIIPGFGAFISTYKPAEIVDNEIKPPSKEVSFSNRIKNNDGILISAIARKAKISQPNALKRIERERENILYQLDKGEKVIVENLGVLFYDEKNEISFTPFQKDNLLLDSFGFQPVSMDDIIEEAIEPESVEVFAEQLTEQENTELISERETGQEMEITVSESDVKKGEEPITEQKRKPIKLPEYKYEPLVVYPEKRKRSVWYLYIIILIPIFIGGYFVLNKFSNSTIKENYREAPSQTEKQEIIVQTLTPVDTLINESVVENEAIETVKTETTENPILTDSKYYLIGGGFKNEENAEKFIVRLKERGIEGIMLGQKGSLYLVGIASFNTENEAYNSLNEHVKKYPDWNLWVFEK
ncbi:MAG TPA: SPOR domain-containing protein [Draconibacterium sp.]|nr:SPOR domain-containing protein [Draconibacterium sp.]